LDFHGLGINGKMSELQAALGLAVLPYMEFILSERKKVIEYYDTYLDFTKLKKIKIRENTTWNYSYYPVVFETEEQLLVTQKRLNEHQIFPRRYFYPSLNTIEYAKGNEMAISESVASRVICLPLYTELGVEKLEKIIKTINY
jgi:dTDP-4-amino-4,6-dideoxygalactose transaminase